MGSYGSSLSMFLAFIPIIISYNIIICFMAPMTNPEFGSQSNETLDSVNSRFQTSSNSARNGSCLTHWIALVGKIFTGNHGLTMNYDEIWGFPVNFTLNHQKPWVFNGFYHEIHGGSFVKPLCQAVLTTSEAVHLVITGFTMVSPPGKRF